MNRYDEIAFHPQNDILGIFENYAINMEKLSSIISKYEPKRIIDIGCGTGNSSGKLSDTYHVLGIDKSIEMIEIAKSKYPNMKFKYIEISEFMDNYKPCSKDVLLLSYVFHNFDCKEKLLNWLKTNVKEGCTAIILDYMFLNSAEKFRVIQDVTNSRQKGLLEFLNDRDFGVVEEIHNYMCDEDIDIIRNQLSNRVWSLEIKLK